MTLQQLRYVTAVAGTGTISHAVQQFYISQPSLTNAIPVSYTHLTLPTNSRV